MEDVAPEKLQAVAEGALKQTRMTLNMLAKELMKEQNLRADQIEIVQESTPRGIRIYVQKKQPKTEGETS